jgi:hypothetical protein
VHGRHRSHHQLGVLGRRHLRGVDRPNGEHCKTCRFPDGKILSAECISDGGTGATEICDVRNGPDGSACKICYEPDGGMLSTCPPDSTITSGPR